MGSIEQICLLVILLSLSTACTREMKKNYGWTFVSNRYPVYINFDTHYLELRTSSTLGSDKRIRMVFQNKKGKDSGGVFVKFSNPPQYMIAYCSQWKPFPAKLPAPVEKVWTFYKTNGTVVVKSNGKDAINFTPSDESCDRWLNWKHFWGRGTVRVKFHQYLDRASDSYKVQLPSNSTWNRVPDLIAFDLDLQQTPLEILTTSKMGSNDQIYLLFYTSSKYYSSRYRLSAGGFKVKFSSKPQFAALYCGGFTDFDEKSIEILHEMPLEKVWTLARTTTGVKIHVNGEKVLDFALSDAVCNEKSWQGYWSRPVAQVRFYTFGDKASRACRVNEPEEPELTTKVPPAKPDTWSPPKGPFWYGSPAGSPPTEAPTKHSPTKGKCWLGRVRISGAERILTAGWNGKGDCESLCRTTSGCHAIFKTERKNERKCMLFGRYNLVILQGRYHWERFPHEIAERKCFDPGHYIGNNSTNPCGDASWECRDRCIRLRWRCDGERDCEGGEDEENCET